MQFKIILILLIIIVSGALGFIITKKPLILQEVLQTSAHTNVKEVLPVSEYTSLVYRYTTVVTHKNSQKFNDIVIPFTEKKYIYTFDAIMKLGIDGNKINVETKGNKINITLPPIEVLSHVIDENSVEVYDQTYNIFNQVDIGETFKINAERKREMENKAKENGIFDEAEDSIEQQITSIFKSLPDIKDKYEIEFIWNKE
jgi:hypothetical protein